MSYTQSQNKTINFVQIQAQVDRPICTLTDFINQGRTKEFEILVRNTIWGPKMRKKQKYISGGALPKLEEDFFK